VETEGDEMIGPIRLAVLLAAIGGVVCAIGWRAHAQESFGPASDVTDLANWTADRTQVEIDSGVLTVHKGEGWLRLNKVLSDFVIGIDVELRGARDKAGVFVRSWPTFDQQQGTPNNGCRVVVSGNIEEVYAAGRVVPHGRGAKELQFDRPAVAEAMSKGSAWHRYEIEGRGGTLTITIDGRLVSEVEGVQNPQGFLALRVDDGSVRVRNVVLREARAPMPRARDGVFAPGGDVVLPRLRRRVNAQFSGDAMSRGVAIRSRDSKWAAGPRTSRHRDVVQLEVSDPAVKCLLSSCVNAGLSRGSEIPRHSV
jgi:hypothetical protein